MEPVFTVHHGHEPPVVPPAAPHHGPGQMEVQDRGLLAGGDGGCGRARLVVALLLFLGVTVGFAFGVYHARHSGRDLAFAVVTYYLFLVLACCVIKLRQLRLRRNPAATAAERARVRVGAWVVSVALGTTVTSRIADAMPGLALKIVVWALSVLLHGLGLYFLFLRRGADRCDADAVELGQRPATALHGGLSPEERV